MSAEFLAVVGMFVVSNGFYAMWARTASRERRAIKNACLARTPAEFEKLEFEDNAPKRQKAKKAEERSIAPIGL